MADQDDEQVVPISDARELLSRKVKALQPGRPLILERHGIPVAGLVTVDDIKTLQAVKEQGMPSTSVIMAFNHAGGASKTSSVRDIGYELTQLGFRVLLMDLDPQANLSTWLGHMNAERDRTLITVLEDYAPLPAPVHVHGMDLIPSHIDLSETESRLPGYSNSEGRLREAVDTLRREGKYDFVLLDPPPSLGKLTANAAACADYVIVPLPARFKGINALAGVQKMLVNYTRLNPKLQVAFYLMTQVDATVHAQEVIEVYTKAFGDRLAGPIKWRPALYNKCQPEGKPIGVLDSKGEARQEVQRVVLKLLQVVGKAVPA